MRSVGDIQKEMMGLESHGGLFVEVCPVLICSTMISYDVVSRYM